MKSIELYLNCTADEAIDTLKVASKDTGFLKTYYTIKVNFKGNKFKLGIRAPRQVLPYAYLVGSISAEGKTAYLQATLTNRKIFKVPRLLLVLAAITFFCGGPYLAYSIFTLSENFSTILAVVFVSLLFLLAGISQNMGSLQQEELEFFLPKIFSKHIKAPNQNFKRTEGAEALPE